jgi:hypothetical protein
MLNVLFIEADNQKNLGGSCIRDIKNMNSYIDNIYNIRRQTTILSFNHNYSLNDLNGLNYNYDSLKNYVDNFKRFCDNVNEGDNVLIMISGHGYQKHNEKGDEKDGMDEYISYNEGIITDNNIYELLIKKLINKTKRIVCIADTCHSGSMFDIDNIDINKNKVISLSSCRDNELSSCDISNVGFGGALTVHLLDINNFLDILFNENIKEIENKIVNKLRPILQCLGQCPVLSSL